MEDGVEVYPRQGKSIFPHQKYQLPVWGDWYFSLRGRWSRSLSPSGEIHLPPPKIPITRLGGRYFLCLLPAGTVGPCAAFPSRGRLASPSLAPPLLRRFGRSRLYTPLTPPVRPAARPAPAATGRPRACQSSRHTPSARRARTATDTPLPTTAAAQNTPRIAASAFPPFCVKLLCVWITFGLSLYSLE